MSSKKTKKRKKGARVEKSVPDVEEIHNVILDSYALISIGYKTILERAHGGDEEHSHAIVAMHHGVKLLKKASDELDQAHHQGGAS
jgi:hypothetical protein